MRALTIVATLAAGLPWSATAQQIDWPQVEEALGTRASEQQGEVHKFSLPRTDLDVAVEGVSVDPALALGSWLAFKPAADGAVVLGDLVLTQDEVAPVMRRLGAGGIDVVALHNHLLLAEPFPMYMHVRGRGDPVAMATAIRAALEQSGTPFQADSGGGQADGLELDTAALDEILGHQGKASGGVYKYSIPRERDVTIDGMAVPPAMGTAIAIGFQPIAGGQAAAAGDFVLTAEEVNPVLRTLHENGIPATALHNHMLTEEPRLFFMHFWVNGDAEMIAQGLRAALDQLQGEVAEQ